jgi:hypothetical protein
VRDFRKWLGSVLQEDVRSREIPGLDQITRTNGLLLADVRCKNVTKEWQLLEAFVGRLAYHFSDQIVAINMQFDSGDHT